MNTFLTSCFQPRHNRIESLSGRECRQRNLNSSLEYCENHTVLALEQEVDMVEK